MAVIFLTTGKTTVWRELNPLHLQKHQVNVDDVC